ncbi:MAG TPA: histidine kinase [Chitinophagaceae bacterium]|nr:histidine kinase [Chitinophagaceae bacterium]
MTTRESINNFLLTLFGFNKTRTRAHIVLLVLIHVAGWCLFFFLPVMLYPVRVNDSRFVTREFFDKSILVIIFYLHYYWLIPKFFEKRRYIQYASLTLLIFVVYLAQHVVIRYNYFLRPGGRVQFFQAPIRSAVLSDSIDFAMGFGRVGVVNDVTYHSDSMITTIYRNGMDRPITKLDPADSMMTAPFPAFPMEEKGLFGVPKPIWAMSLNNAVSSFTLLLLMGGFIRLAYSFVRNQNEKKALENANLNAEVNFLKSQINPHFLFNTLNGIYSQAHAKSANTEHSILKLSDLLRYVLYDSGDDKVELAKDIQYLTNYIDLQKLRLSQKVTIQYDVKGDAKGKQIAPLLLITFVENAFKHGISYSRPSTIKIEIGIFEKTLTLLVSNPVTETNSFASGGLGLKNVTRRLDLLYPGKYLLDIIHNDHLHIVNLKIDLNGD